LYPVPDVFHKKKSCSHHTSGLCRIHIRTVAKKYNSTGTGIRFPLFLPRTLDIKLAFLQLTHYRYLRQWRSLKNTAKGPFKLYLLVADDTQQTNGQSVVECLRVHALHYRSQHIGCTSANVHCLPVHIVHYFKQEVPDAIPIPQCNLQQQHIYKYRLYGTGMYCIMDIVEECLVWTLYRLRRD
jgi:hypothetical protein